MKAFLGNPRHRTLIGLALGVLFVPVMLGITGCFELKTPVGDPDQGWADPRISGAWLSGDPTPSEDDTTLWLFEPWDEKTWLVTLLTFQEGHAGDSPPASEPGTEPTEPGRAGAEGAAVTATDPEIVEPVGEPASEEDPDAAMPILPPEEVARLLAALSDMERLEFSGGGVFKGWLTSIGPYRYLVLEPRLAASRESGLEPTEWWVFRVVLQGSALRLDIFDSGRDDLDEVTTRGEAEAIIARHASDPEFFEPFLLLQRVPREAMDDVDTLIEVADMQAE